MIEIKYSWQDLNDVEGISGISSRKKVHYFLHKETYFLCNNIGNLLKAIDTKSAITKKIQEITHPESIPYRSTLIVHEIAHNMALKTWNKQKKSAPNQKIEISKGASLRFNKTARWGKVHSGNWFRGNEMMGGERRKFKMKILKHGRSLTRIKMLRSMDGTEKSLNFKQVQDFYEEKYRKAHGGYISQMFFKMAKYANDTRDGYANVKGTLPSGSNSVDYDFQDTKVILNFHSQAFGEKHFTEKDFEINPWMQSKPRAEGKDLYSNSRNKQAIEQGIKNSFINVYAHVKRNGLLYNK